MNAFHCRTNLRHHLIRCHERRPTNSLPGSRKADGIRYKSSLDLRTARFTTAR